jgi:hypothetical protein
MTSERLGEMFKGDSIDTCAGKFPACVDGGTSGHVKGAQMGSEDPHRRERKSSNVIKSGVVLVL